MNRSYTHWEVNSRARAGSWSGPVLIQSPDPAICGAFTDPHLEAYKDEFGVSNPVLTQYPPPAWRGKSAKYIADPKRWPLPIVQQAGRGFVWVKVKRLQSREDAVRVGRWLAAQGNTGISLTEVTTAYTSEAFDPAEPQASDPDTPCPDCGSPICGNTSFHPCPPVCPGCQKQHTPGCSVEAQ